MIWPFPNDVAVSFGFGHLQRRLRFDGLGRPYVRGCTSEVFLLRPGGLTADGREWIPLTKRAADQWTAQPHAAFEAEDDAAERQGIPGRTKS